MQAEDLDRILAELKVREPIFHRRQFGTSRTDLERMTADDFWEIGASGRIYARDYVISNLLERYVQPEPHDWPCREFSIQRLAESLFLISYTLDEPDRTTRRATIWRHEEFHWKIVFHQGTVVS
jgi:hypothetical protein